MRLTQQSEFSNFKMCDLNGVRHLQYATGLHLKPCLKGKLHLISVDADTTKYLENISGEDSNDILGIHTMMGDNNQSLVDFTQDASPDQMFPAIIECFAVIFLGYLAGKCGIIGQAETKGLNTFIGTFSLPCLIFLSMAQLDLSSVNWWFLFAIFLAKSLVFFVVIIICLLVNRPIQLNKAGIFAIFATQSNDFALGYPVISALYKNSHPGYANYLYLVAPVNLLLLNPIAFILMEFSKQQKGVEEANETTTTTRIRRFSVPSSSSVTSGISSYAIGHISAGNVGPSGSSINRILKRVFKGVLLNPIVLMTALGMCGNLIFKHCLPQILEGILKVFGSAFSGTALFSLGLTMVGSAATLKGSGIVVPGILIGIKLLVMPVLTREIVSLIQAGGSVNETVSLANFGFLYGTFPTAPGVFVYANQFDVAVQMIASAMVACTFLSAPLMFVSAKMITLTKLDPKDYVTELDNFLFHMSILGLIASTWVIGIFILSRKWSKIPHFMTLCLAISQAIACIGAILWSWIGVGTNPSETWSLYLQFGVLAFGVLSSRIWTSILAASLVFLRCRSLCFVLRLRPYMSLIGWGIPGLLVTLLMVAVKYESLSEKQDPNFQYGETQAIVALFILVISFIITIGSLIMQKRYERKYGQYARVSMVGDSTTSQHHNTNINNTDEESLINNESENILQPSTPPPNVTSTRSRPNSSHRGRCNSFSCEKCPSQQIHNNEVSNTSAKVKEIEDLGNTTTDDDDGSDIFSYNDDLCAPKRFTCSASQRRRCTYLINKYRSDLIEPEEVGITRDRDDEFNMLRHIILLLFLCFSMFVGIALCFWTLIVEEKSGIYIELVFLDAALNFGQGLFTFMLFGLNTKMIILPIHKLYRKFIYGEDQLPKFEELSSETKQVCEQFLTFHFDKCHQDIVRDRVWRNVHYKEVFQGHELVDFLILIGVSKDEAVRYGRHLISGRVIRCAHAKNFYNFHDQPFFYTFSPADVDP